MDWQSLYITLQAKLVFSYCLVLECIMFLKPHVTVFRIEVETSLTELRGLECRDHLFLTCRTRLRVSTRGSCSARSKWCHNSTCIREMRVMFYDTGIKFYVVFCCVLNEAVFKAWLSNVVFSVEVKLPFATNHIVQFRKSGNERR